MTTPGDRKRAWAWRATLLVLGIGTALLAARAARGPWARWRTERALPRGLRPGVLLVTLDSLRCDRLGFCGGAGAVESPRFAALAAGGIVFERAYAQAPLCLPSHASILTGLVPARHGLRDDRGPALAEGVSTLAEAFRRAGYRTAAFVSSTTLDHRYGLDRGFDSYDDDLGPPGKQPGRHESARAGETVGRALAWAAKADPRPAFVWVHLDDAEAAHDPPEPFGRKYAGRAYEGEIAYLDQEVGRLVDGVRAQKPDTLVALLADHGEALGDHGEPRHGFFVYSATTRVPLLLWMPGRLPAGLRIHPIVRAMDVMPTLLDLTGLALPPRLDGASLVPLLLGPTTEGPGPAPIDNDAPRSGYGLSPLAGLRSGPYLYVRAPRPELYDVAQDGQEKEDVAARLPAVVARLEAELVRYVPDPPERSHLADPKERLDLVDRFQSALALEARGDTGGAEAGLVALLSEAPGFVFARQRLSEIQLRGGRTKQALATLKEEVDRGMAGETTYLNLALACHRLGDPAATLEWLRKGVVADPRSPSLRHRLGRVLLERERFAEAEAELRKATQLEPRFADAHLALAETLAGLGRGDEARTERQEALALSPAARR